MMKNWAGNVTFSPAHVSRPRTEQEVADALAAATRRGGKVRAMGAGHSFTPLAATEDTLMNLDGLTGIVRVEGSDVTFWGGTRLRDIAGLLAPWGLALPNMGDVDTQSIAGAVSTAAHGTGLAFPGYSACVTHLRLALADGRIIDCSKDQEPDLFEAARVGLGAIGIIVAATIACVPAFSLRVEETTERVYELLPAFHDRAREADHLEFFWFPGTPRATVKQLWRLPDDTALEPLTRTQKLAGQELLSNGVYGSMVRLSSLVPPLAPVTRAVASRHMAGPSFTDRSAAVFVSPRRVRFRETEYCMPIEALPDVVRDAEAAVRRTGHEVTFPLEVRVTKGDDTWLGPATGRDSVFVAVHRYHREPFEPVLAAVEPVFRAYGGRPHWGKEHTLTAADVTAMYPRAEDFRRARREADPSGTLLNDHVGAMLS